MKKQMLAAQLLTMCFAFNATAGGVGSTQSCTNKNEILATAPLKVYLPDGSTQKTVGEASLVSRKTTCDGTEYESIDVQYKLDDEIQPYGIKIKDTITGFDNQTSLEFRLKELVNSTDRFDTSTYGKTKITHFGEVGRLSLNVEAPSILFWMNTQAQVTDLITAKSNGMAPDNSPLACSLDQAFVSLTKVTNGSDGLSKDLRLTAIFRGPLQLCP